MNIEVLTPLTMQSLRILMVAYACDPEGGGEHWLGWGWALEASHTHKVVLLTTSKARPALERIVGQHHIELHCLDVPNWVRWLSGFPPGAGAWFRKLWWQRMSLRLARKLHSTQPFDVVHQTTFHTFRIPFCCSRLGIPSVWGPIAGGEAVPPGFDKYLGEAASRAEKNRTFLNRLCLRLPWVRRSLASTSRIVVSNRTTLEFLPSEFHSKCLIISPNALRNEDLQADTAAFITPDQFKMLFAGNCAPTRAMPLVFEALASGLSIDWSLRVVGTGTALEFWKQEVARLNISNKVEFTGAVPRQRLQEYYQDTSVLVFPALRDSGGSALLEAMTLGIPILTLDWAGPGEMVNTESAVMVTPTTPEQSVQSIREGLIHLATHPREAECLGQAARKRALENFTWQSKGDKIRSVYRDLVN